MGFWEVMSNDWHKIVVVILVLAHAWKFFFTYIRPAVHKEPESMSIILPKEGCTITIKPLEDSKSSRQ